jgi:hypothetical protein
MDEATIRSDFGEPKTFKTCYATFNVSVGFDGREGSARMWLFAPKHFLTLRIVSRVLFLLIRQGHGMKTFGIAFSF